MVFDGSGLLVKQCDGFDGSLWSKSCLTRVPFDEQRALPEECFDLIAKSLSGESAATTQCVFRCDNDGADVDCDADLEMFAHDRK